jgi:hypothetical protein
VSELLQQGGGPGCRCCLGDGAYTKQAGEAEHKRLHLQMQPTQGCQSLPGVPGVRTGRDLPGDLVDSPCSSYLLLLHRDHLGQDGVPCGPCMRHAYCRAARLWQRVLAPSTVGPA